MNTAKKKVRLVLAAGGARGMAHIGVIERLEAEGHEIIEVVGCSMGAVVGGLYAAGHLSEYKDWLLGLDRTAVFRQMDFTITRHGFLKGEKVFNTITEMFGPRRIEDLPLPFAAVATEMSNGEEVVFRSGDLFQALRASISIPGIFTPVRHEGGQWVDGGVVNPLPLNLVSKQSEDEIIVAVDINAPGAATVPVRPINNSSSSPLDFGWLKLNWPFGKKDKGALGIKALDLGLLEVLQTSYEHMQNRMIRMMVERYQPDLLVEIARQSCGMFDFHKAKMVINAGSLAYDKAVQKSEKVL